MEREFTQDGVQSALDHVMDSASSSEDTGSETDTADEEYLPPLKSESSDVSDSEDIGDTEAAAGWTSRCGEIQWAPTNWLTERYIPVATGMEHGPTCYAIARTSSLEDTLNLYLTDEIMMLILNYTNLQGRRNVTGWRDLDRTDLLAYVGLLLLAGVYRSPNELTRSLWDDHTGRAIFRATMSYATFRLINTCLRFDDRLSRPRENKLAAISELWEMWTARLPLLFNPGADVCVEEQLVPFRGRTSLRQYIPKKPAKYGIKIWVTCDVKTSYAWRMQIYTGRQPGTPAERNQGKRVVLEMTEGLRGVTVTVDNFFTSFALAEELLQRKMALVGTIQRNKPELPPELLQLRMRAVLSSMFAFTRTHTAVSYMPKRGKNVLLLSTRHREAAVRIGEKRKPLMIEDYNRCKGGVDHLDKVLGTFTCRRRTSRWPQVLFYNLLDVSVYNAFLIWVAINPSWQRRKNYRRRLFIEELGKTLIAPQMARRRQLPRTSSSAALVQQAQSQAEPSTSQSPNTTPRRRQCVVCRHKRKVFTSCSKCGLAICKEHSKVVCTTCLT